MKTRLLDELKSRVVVADGAMGTELAARGLEAGESSAAWNLTHPDTVKSVHTDYITAGSDLLLTNTFAATRWHLEKQGLRDKLPEIAADAARIAREAAGEDSFVLGDIGPTGELMEPLGVHNSDEFYEAFAEVVRAFPQDLLDGIIIETMTAIEELTAALRAVRENSDLPVIASMAFDPDSDGRDFHTMMGVTVEKFAEEATRAGADIIGLNCGTVDIEQITAIARRIRSATDLMIHAKPNAGKPDFEGGKTIYRQSPDDMAGHVDDLIAAGARIVGGCCGTTPAHISAIAQVVKSR